MRFATIATSAIVAIASPFILNVVGPQMSGDRFLSAVRCVAYQDVIGADAELGPVKMRLNSEARRQPAVIAAQAHAEIGAIAREAVNTRSALDRAMVRERRAAACAGDAELALGGQSNGEG